MQEATRRIPTLPDEYSTAMDSLLRDALMHDAGCAVAVLEAGNLVRECNDAFALLLGHSTSEAMAGQTLHTALDDATTQTIEQAARHVLSHAEPVVVESHLGSRFVRMTCRLFETTAVSSPRCVLVVIAPWDPDTPIPADAHILHPETNRNDPLGSLTPREREVLQYIGMGLPTAEIARKLHRSVKTIEGHRVSLGLKLGVSNRVQLARIAIRSGLSPLSSSMIEPKPTPEAD